MSDEKLITDDEVIRAWLGAKTQNPLLEKSAFAEDIGRPVKTVEKILKPVLSKETEILSRYIANEIGKAAEARGVEPVDMTWYEFKKHIDLTWGRNNAGIKVYHITQAGGYNRIRDAYFPATKTTRQQVEKFKMATYAAHNRKSASIFAEQRVYADSMEELAERLFKGMATSRGAPPKVKEVERAVTVVLSDLHFGSDIGAEETGVLTYGKTEEARRLAKIAREVATYKPQYRENTSLNVLLIGDIIQGHLHNIRDSADHAEQEARALRLLIQFITYVASHYGEVNVYCATGNHGRNKNLHKERATSKKYDSHETFIYYSLKQACDAAGLQHVKFHIPKTPFVAYTCLGHRFFATHGDTVLNPGNPGKAIPIGSLENQTNRINASLSDAEEYAAFIVGHVHVGSMTHLGNGAVMLTNGPLVPPDPFCVSISLPEANCGQWLFETVPGYPVGDARFLQVDAETDKDESLEKIIAPWQGFHQ
jgi:hypothetical protein